VTAAQRPIQKPLGLPPDSRGETKAGRDPIDAVCLPSRLYELGPGVKSLAWLMSAS
jgi:hypothetical protein